MGKKFLWIILVVVQAGILEGISFIAKFETGNGFGNPVAKRYKRICQEIHQRYLRVKHIDHCLLLITTEAMVAELPKKNAPAGGMPPGGGMGGMDF